MKTVKVIFFIIIGTFLGCAHNKPKINVKMSHKVDNCEINYKKCNLKCEISAFNEPKWKEIVCKSNCKIMYDKCKK
jgi:hypothetical protein